MKKNDFLIGGICVAILLTCLVTYMIYTNKNNVQEEEWQEFSSENTTAEENLISNDVDVESASTEIGKTVDESKNELKETTTKTEETSKKEENTAKVENVSEEENVTKEEEKEELTFSAPVKGEVIREFSTESLVYSSTLDEWITHNGIDVKADKTTVVSSAAKGTVYAIKTDPRYGLTVIINHEDGYQTVYSNLLTSEFVVEGEEVEEGQTIGTVGNTAAFEFSDDYHLHFEVLKDNEYVDPTIYMSFE